MRDKRVIKNRIKAIYVELRDVDQSSLCKIDTNGGEAALPARLSIFGRTVFLDLGVFCGSERCYLAEICGWKGTILY